MGATGSKDKLGGSPSVPQMAGGMPGAAGEMQSPELKCAVPVAFRWHHAAQREVYVVGSFSNWQTKIRLTREPETDAYSTVVQIVPGIHQYKFIVDGEWRCAQDQPRCLDSVGNENNCLEVEEAEAPEPEPLEEDQMGKEEPPSPRSSYNCQSVDPDEYIKDPPAMPPHLGFALLNQPPKKSQGSLLAVPNHSTLNHSYICRSLPEGLSAVGMTCRFRGKFVTTVFYSPAPTQ
uniref:Association with the SNF1 complex (ASC) domain-containing protein n=1 Tax=Hemiselmis andersenii TaxID=464988 RepID=A0A6U4VAS0_HEMAN|mmetsp:Transcript_21588/g.49479  ORF Transcript_21588/g.49479 Transcript_21588/m.49479 type:complete len:233 (+) Transcript_21588:82-780(+)